MTTNYIKLNELVGKIKNAYLYAQTGSTKAVLEDILPELKESKDERIRKAIRGWIYTRPSQFFDGGFSKEEMLAWLEKQGEQKLTNSYCQEHCKGFQETGKCFADGDCKAKTIAETIDKVEPKFEKGKWYVCNTSRYTDFVVGKAYYCPKNGMLKPNENEMARYVARDCFHLWTIKDAKDGDVLVNMFDDFIFIYNSTSILQAYCYYCSGRGHYCHWNMQEVKPATKEQRDLLFQKMKEAGYMWDDEKKELKKIEQKSADNEMIEILRTEYEKGRADAIAEMQNTAWSEEDELHIRELENLVKQVWATAERENDKDKIHKMSNLSFFLKTLKPQLKQEWSKDDEAIWTEISDLLWEGYKQSSSKFSWDDIRNWVKLKFLKHQYAWKPSDEQLDALQYVYRNFNPLPTDKLGWNSLKTLELMYHDLKKLKE